jgi:NDP-sugar pyrophosphorylase family protein
MKAVILAGGLGTRLAPYTTVFPKPMLPIGEKPILSIIIQQLVYYGFKEIIISVGYLAELLQAYFATYNNIPKGVKISFVREKKPLGTAGSLSLIPKPSEPILVMNGDTLTALDYRELMNFHKEKGALITIATHKRHVKIDFGVIHVNGQDELNKYVEKPVLDYLVSMGIYVFEPKVLDYIEPDQRLDFPELVQKFLSENKKIQGYITSTFWLDIGRHDDYSEAVKIFDKIKHKLLKEA